MHADDGIDLDSPLEPDARAFDAPALARETVAISLTAMQVLAGHGWGGIHARARALARGLAETLTERGFVVGPRGDTTLVAFEMDDPVAARDRCMQAGIIVRSLPGESYLRASTGAWNDESDVERLLAAL